MAKILTNRVGYLFLIACLMGLFFINNAEALQTNCSNSDSPTEFKYRIPVYNITNSSEYVPIKYADCNVTIYRRQLGVDNVLNSSKMINLDDGTYDCFIGRDFATGKFNTFYTCDVPNATVQNFGRFEIVPDDVPLSIIGFFIGLAVFFLFYSVKLEKQFGALKIFMFLLTLLMFYIIFALTLGVVGEEGAGATLVGLSETILIGYTYLFSFLVIYVIVMWILQILAMFSAKKKEKANKGVIFD